MGEEVSDVETEVVAPERNQAPTQIADNTWKGQDVSKKRKGQNQPSPVNVSSEAAPVSAAVSSGPTESKKATTQYQKAVDKTKKAPVKTGNRFANLVDDDSDSSDEE